MEEPGRILHAEDDDPRRPQTLSCVTQAIGGSIVRCAPLDRKSVVPWRVGVSFGEAGPIRLDRAGISV